MNVARIRRCLLVLLVTLLTLLPHTARPVLAATTYVVSDLGTFGGTSIEAHALNVFGQVVGFANLPGDTAGHAFLWQGNLMHDLGTLGGPQSSANAINVFSQVAGVADTTLPAGSSPFCTPQVACHAFLWARGVMHDLGTLGGANSAAFSLNALGQVVGQAQTTSVDPTSLTGAVEGHAFVWVRGVMHDLGTLGGPDSNASGINDRGQIVGVSMFNDVVDPQIQSPDFHAFFWERGLMQDLGTLGGHTSASYGLNNHAQVVGTSDLSNQVDFHGFLWQHGVMLDLGTVPGDTASVAEGINDQGQVVGASGTPQAPLRAVVWQNGIMIDLNTLIPAGSGWQLLQAFAINARGQIVGFGTHYGQTAAFLLSPQRASSAPPTRAPAVSGPAVSVPAAQQGILGWGTRSSPRLYGGLHQG